MKCGVCGKKPFSDKDLVQAYNMNLCHTCWVRLYAIDNGRRIADEHPELEQYLPK
jgi:hypothetical protein